MLSPGLTGEKCEEQKSAEHELNCKRLCEAQLDQQLQLFSLVLVLFSLSLELSHINVALGVHACGNHLHPCHDS